MATTAYIGVMDEGGSITFIYCHAGDPESVGHTLAKHWGNPDKVAELMELGNLSFLGEELRSPETDNDFKGTYAYHREFDAGVWWRDRGGSFEPGTLKSVPPGPPQPRQAIDKDAYTRITCEGWISCAYLLTRSGWEIYQVRGAAHWRPLKRALR